MLIRIAKIVVPLVLLQLMIGCQPNENDTVKSELDSLKQEVSKLSKEVGKLENEVQEMKKLAQSPPKKGPKIIPTQTNFTDDGNVPLLGSSDAEVAIIEFSDFQCPYCKRFIDTAFKQIKENYIDTGKVQYVARDFPLSFHPQAKGAAIAAMCSFKQDSYWAMRDMLFGNVKQLGDAFYRKAATDLSLNMEEFSECIKDKSVAEKVEKDLALGMSLGVRGTPSFLIGRVENGNLVEPKMVVGAQSYPQFRNVIEQALAKK